MRHLTPPNPLCRGGWGESIDAHIPHSSYSLNESEMIQQHWIKWHYIIWHSFSFSDEIRMSATFDSPQPPLQRGLGGVNWRTHSVSRMRLEWVRQLTPPNPLWMRISYFFTKEFDSPQPPLQRGLGGVNWRTHSTLILLTEWEWNDSTTLDQMTLHNLTLIQYLGWH